MKIALDFDGVLHNYGPDGWDGVIPTGDPVDGALEFVEWLIDKGYEPVIHSARCNDLRGQWEIIRWLARHGFPQLPVPDVKPKADLYVDDRGFRFEGDFFELKMFLIDNPLPGRWR